MKHQLQNIRKLFHGLDMDNGLTEGGDVRALEIYEALSELERLAGEPFGHYVYFPDQQRGEFVNNIDELCEDMTNDENHEVTPLYRAAPPAQPQYEAGDMAAVHNAGFRAGVASVAQQPQAEAYNKTELNFFVQDLYDRGMEEGKRGHYETLFHCVHQAIKRVGGKSSPAWEHHARKLTQWLHCMSYNDSYFGEPAGLVKQVTGELNRLIGAAPQQAETMPKKDLMFSTVAMQTRHDKRIERIVNTLEQVKQEQAERYQTVREAFWWRVRIGTGTQTIGRCYTETEAQRLAAELQRAFNDGAFCVEKVVCNGDLIGAAAPQQAEAVHELCQSCRNSDIYACTCTFPRTKPETVPGLADFLADLSRSRAKYPNNARMWDGLMGEVDELRRAYHGDGDQRAEAFDVAVCAFRIATEGDAGRNTLLAAPQQAEAVPEMHDALCPALTGGDCTCTPPATIDKAWAQFCGGIGRGPDAPYPGMIEAFEAHYGQTFTDKDWREETGVWAAAWKAAKANGEAAPRQAEAVPPTQAAQDVLAERQRQVNAEGWTTQHDDKHGDGSMALAAACYACNSAVWADRPMSIRQEDYVRLANPGFRWPWAMKWWKPKSQRQDLVKAGALILAEIERLDRASAIAAQGEKP